QMFIPVSNSDDLSTKPPQQKNSLPHRDYVSKGINGVLKEKKDDYEVVTNIDDNVGRIVSAVKNSGIEDNTIIIYLSDNGVFYGEHQMLHKGPTFYEEQIKTPFIFRYPKISFADFKTSALVSSMDIMPTLLDILKIPSPPDIQGKSFLSILRGEAQQTRSSVFMEYYVQQSSRVPMRGIVWNNWKWNHYRGSKGENRDYELYNLADDPFEINNIMDKIGKDDDPLGRLLKDAHYGPVIQQLRKEKAVWQSDSNDEFKISLSGTSTSSPSSGTLNISWTTDKDASSEIEYSEKDCSGCSPVKLDDFNFSKNHSVNITSLKSGVAYNIKIFSINPYGDGGYKELIANL
ncbi:sulfatase-like hydrolase/transferase, partial [Candidatus Wolfebacteria bacterium]|nr:sulfatase-like hydrolase/transferase [Candidatus Wolfebacteria bacterium]